MIDLEITVDSAWFVADLLRHAPRADVLLEPCLSPKHVSDNHAGCRIFQIIDHKEVLQVAEKALQTYERDGWSEFNTQIVPERREIRPTADRGPILLCVDTSGSMRGAREVVAKALALECMRAARAQVTTGLCCCNAAPKHTLDYLYSP